MHLPDQLLDKVDRRAKELGISRNHYIVRALESAIREETSWSEEFRSMLERAAKDVEGHRAVEDTKTAISRSRTRKGSPKL